MIIRRATQKVRKISIMGHMLGHGDYPVIKMTNMMSYAICPKCHQKNNVGDDRRCGKMMFVLEGAHPY